MCTNATHGIDKHRHRTQIPFHLELVDNMSGWLGAFQKKLRSQNVHIMRIMSMPVCFRSFALPLPFRHRWAFLQRRKKRQTSLSVHYLLLSFISVCCFDAGVIFMFSSSIPFIRLRCWANGNQTSMHNIHNTGSQHFRPTIFDYIIYCINIFLSRFLSASSSVYLTLCCIFARSPCALDIVVFTCACVYLCLLQEIHYATATFWVKYLYAHIHTK